MRFKAIKLGFIICGMLCLPPAFAGFATYTNVWPDDAAVVNEKIIDEKKVDICAACGLCIRRPACSCQQKPCNCQAVIATTPRSCVGQPGCGITPMACKNIPTCASTYYSTECCTCPVPVPDCKNQSDCNKCPDPGECATLFSFNGKQPINDYCRLYVKFGGNYITSKATDIKNTSGGVLVNISPTVGDVEDTYFSWEVGIGTRYKCLRYEIEYVHTKTIIYSASPVLVGRGESMVSELYNRSVLLNIFYDFDTFAYFKPYVGGILGVAWNRTNSTLSGGTLGTGASQSANFISPLVWGLTVGGRIPFWERWRAYVQYRYVNNNKIQWKASGGLQMRGYYIFSGVSLGVAYIF